MSVGQRPVETDDKMLLSLYRILSTVYSAANYLDHGWLGVLRHPDLTDTIAWTESSKKVHFRMDGSSCWEPGTDFVDEDEQILEQELLFAVDFVFM